MSGYPQEFQGRVNVAAVDATTPEAEAEVQALGFNNHGLVIRDDGGTVLFKQPDHDVNTDEVHARLRELLDG